MERHFARHEFTARHLISCSDAESIHLRELLDFEPGSRQKLEALWLGYSDSRGIPELRAEIRKLYTTVQDRDIVAHTGAQEPILNLFMGLIGPGDHVITHFPGYQSSYSVPKNLGAEVSLWKARPEEGWRLDLDELKRLLKPNTKLVILNCPHNPSGYVMPAAEYAALIAILRERGILLLSDEVYRGLEARAADRLPAAVDVYENAISLGVMSKAYGLAGLRVGWIATKNERVRLAFEKQKDYTTICGPIVAEWLASLALRHAGRLLERNRATVGANTAVFSAFLERRGERFEWVPPGGGTMGFPWRRDGKSMEPLAAKVLEREGLMLITGKYFDTDEKYFRLGLGRKDFPEVLAILERNLD
ncbi:MAG: aminotransferase class I/II-fold pyridoxal phosphate-dependent enzyme [Bdellovibrionales bacterium]|nr:aminotransferase class I/II-fold pyridoxal phosphate-dependent enzyme [Bdellovibrionales bacterium]